MAKDHIALGSSPVCEPCVGINNPNYMELAWAECGRFIDLLKQHAKNNGQTLPPGCNLKIVTHPHDFGDYLDVVVEFDDTHQEAMDAAIWLENNIPENW